MSQSAILWRMAEMGAIILMKTWCEGVRPKQQTPNWYVLFHHEAKITTRIVMRGSCMKASCRARETIQPPERKEQRTDYVVSMKKRQGYIVVQGEKSMMGCHDPETFWMRKRLS